MATEYRNGKKQVYGCYLSENDAELVMQAVDKAANKIGVDNNRKSRLALIEIARHYNETA